tara:strand:+ start:367 stop:768 length:402 start_codon:yes stop_codon:yes gene_type:complete
LQKNKKFLNNPSPKKEDMIFVSVNGKEVPKEGYEEIRDEDGNLRGKGNFKNGVRSGFWQFIYPNGKIDQSGYYGRDGKRLSINYYGDTWDYYREDGTKIEVHIEELSDEKSFFKDLFEEFRNEIAEDIFKQDD